MITHPCYQNKQAATSETKNDWLSFYEWDGPKFHFIRQHKYWGFESLLLQYKLYTFQNTP